MIKYIRPLPVSSCNGLVSEMYKQIRRDFGFVGDIFIMHSPSPPLLASLWAALRETELVGSVPRGIKEAVAAAVARANQCSFCVDAHTTMLMAAGNHEVAQKISKDQVDSISDEKMYSIVKWALATRSPRSSILLNPPFTAQEAPEIIGTAVTTHYITRMMDVLLTNKTLVPINHSLMNYMIKRVIALLFSSSIRKSRKPGESIVFLSEALLPDDLRWAKSHPIISRAFACFAADTEAAGHTTLPEEVRSNVRHYIDEWDGKEPGLSRKWVEQTVKTLSGPSKIAAKLALLTAIAPYQIDEDLIQDFRSAYEDDVQLLNVLSWSSFMAARKIGSWLSEPNYEEEGQ
ncbi:carboxymuconolactone decarboxylase family protein [Paenibacillus piri]|uniref:Alkylhydroperoxidase n=1 Tax=Paenibacillus piri TaxID=2547395 RepID=A0A4R5KF55_9BACL|nr:carboxymuconolactone decarboxylase family protein [Paenibacillus piri]TDF92790.1 alkylhydroperoxidase [Paenibacillus piri]